MKRLKGNYTEPSSVTREEEKSRNFKQLLEKKGSGFKERVEERGGGTKVVWDLQLGKMKG